MREEVVSQFEITLRAPATISPAKENNYRQFCRVEKNMLYHERLVVPIYNRQYLHKPKTGSTIWMSERKNYTPLSKMMIMVINAADIS